MWFKSVNELLGYGTAPIVRETGGLKDTIEPYNEYESTELVFHLQIIMLMRCLELLIMRKVFIIIKSVNGTR